jgi:hypothetical protein
MKTWPLVVFALLVIAGAGAWFFSADRKPVVGPASLTVYFSGDTRGRLVPCGCFTGQMGGLTRLKTFLSAQASPTDLKLDIGDAVAGPEDFQVMQYDYILRAYADMAYDALNVGHREAQLSAAQLEQIRQTSPVTVLSANLFNQATGQRIFDADKIIERSGRKIAVVGVLDAGCMTEGLGAGLRVEPMDTVLEELLPGLRKKADAIILLAFTDESGLDRLAQQFYEANIILGGKVSQPSQKLIKENRSYVLYTANESRTVGVFHSHFAPRLSADDFKMIMLDPDIPEDPAIIGLATQYRDQIRQTHLNIDDLRELEANEVPGVRNAAHYTGSTECISCHPSAAKVWDHTAHSQAFASLTAKKAGADPNCIGCHTVGFGAASGYQRQFQGARLASVGCESCHGPGSLHVGQRQAHKEGTFKFRPLAAGDCKQCHHGEFSPPFDWDASWEKIKHGNEPRLSKNQ